MSWSAYAGPHQPNQWVMSGRTVGPGLGVRAGTTGVRSCRELAGRWGDYTRGAVRWVGVEGRLVWSGLMDSNHNSPRPRVVLPLDETPAKLPTA